MITYHEYNNGYNNPVYNAHKNLGVHYTWQNTVEKPSPQVQREEWDGKGKADVWGDAAGKASGRGYTGAGLGQMTNEQGGCGLRHKCCVRAGWQ